MTIFIANKFLPRVRHYFIRFLIKMFFFSWFLLGYLNDAHYMIPLIVFMMFSLLLYNDFKRGYLVFINELRFNDNKKNLEVIYFSEFCKKIKKKIPYEFLYYEPSIAPKRAVYGDYTHCEIYYIKKDVTHNKITSHDLEFCITFYWGLGNYDQVEFKRILKKLSEVGTMYKFQPI